jgi:hypothetical protein
VREDAGVPAAAESPNPVVAVEVGGRLRCGWIAGVSDDGESVGRAPAADPPDGGDAGIVKDGEAFAVGAVPRVAIFAPINAPTTVEASSTVAASTTRRPVRGSGRCRGVRSPVTRRVGGRSPTSRSESSRPVSVALARRNGMSDSSAAGASIASSGT